MTQLSDFINSKSLLIELTDRDTGEFKEVKWMVRSLIPSEMSIQLNFDNPLSISTGAPQKARVSVLNENLFLTLDKRILIDGFTSLDISLNVPPQFASQAEME